MQMLKALWGYRGFITGSVKREFQSKYRNSLLGAAWTVLNPLAMIIVYGNTCFCLSVDTGTECLARLAQSVASGGTCRLFVSVWYAPVPSADWRNGG